MAVLEEKAKSHGHYVAAAQADDDDDDDDDQPWLGKMRPSVVTAIRLLEARIKYMYIGFYTGWLGNIVVLFDCHCESRPLNREVRRQGRMGIRDRASPSGTASSRPAMTRRR